MIRLTASIAALALAGCAGPMTTADSAPDPKLEAALAGRTEGRPVSCITLRDAQSSTTYRNAIVYRDGRTLYVNRVGTCPGLRFDPILVTRTFSGQLCRGEIIQLADRSGGGVAGSCALQDFVPYTSPR